MGQVMKLYDPLGILTPFLMLGKLLLRETWEHKLKWDDPLPPPMTADWVRYFTSMCEVIGVQYDRCLTPLNAKGSPSLIILSDASEKAYGFASYIRSELQEGNCWCRLIMAKSRVAPLVNRSTPQLELNGAVMSERARQLIEKEMRFKFERVHHLIDSETVLHMLSKSSTRFKLYEGVCIGEIQAATDGNMEQWSWIAGKTNSADWVTRGRTPSDLGPKSDWFN